MALRRITLEYKEVKFEEDAPGLQAFIRRDHEENNDGYYTQAEETCYRAHCYVSIPGKVVTYEVTGSDVLLYKLKRAIDFYNNEDESEQKLYLAAIKAYNLLAGLSPKELNQKKYRMVLALSIEALWFPTQGNADILKKHAERALKAAPRPYLQYGIAAALLLLAVTAFTFATIFTLGTAPIVAAAIAVGVKAAIVSSIGFSVGGASILSSLGLALHSFFKPPVQSEHDRAVTEFSQEMKLYSKSQR
jgi:hypothetical protein